MLQGDYNGVLVAFSLIIAVIASYTALNMAGRVSNTKGRTSALWFVGGSFAMGFGIWSMHFIGMLAFSLPIELGYDIPTTLLSMVISIAASAFALWLVCQRNLPSIRLLMGGVLMGIGIAAMHYTGMYALLMTPSIVYTPWIFTLSVFIAVLVSGVALWIAFQLRRDSRRALIARIWASLLMGCAIVGMHYTGMAAAQFPLGSFCGAANIGIDTKWLATLIIVTTFAVLAIALVVSMLDRRTSIISTSLDKANNDLLHLALHDSLTGLPNRVLLNDRLEQLIEKSTLSGKIFAVLFLDLDGFKAINDIYGHHIGDDLLKTISTRISKSKREGDTVARLGGDEFVILIDIKEPQDAVVFSQRLIEVIGAPFYINDCDFSISASIGIALFPHDGRTVHELLINSDAAMYYVKELGRAGYSFFEASMNSDVQKQVRLQQELRRALVYDEFILHYQPKMIAPDGPLIGVEALLRWQSKNSGIVPPDQFLPIAEKTGLIIPIGNWVIDEACRQMRQWYDAGHKSWTVSVNLSTVQLGYSGLVEIVQSALQRHSLDACHLVFEITESTAMRDAEASLVVLKQLSDLGVGISIDDFGTGYSSLLYLKRLPADELKIDRGFVTELAQGNDDEAIISAIIALGKTLGLKIVAEGVETSEQQELLTHLGCDSLQGYLLGKPMTAEDITKKHGRAKISKSI